MKFSYFILMTLVSLSLQVSATETKCQNCILTPVDITQVQNISELTHHLNQTEIESLSKTLFEIENQNSAPNARKANFPVSVSHEPFDLEKYRKDRKPIPYSAGPETSVFLLIPMSNQFSTATEGKNTFRLEAAAGNSMIHQTELQRKDGKTRNQKSDMVGQVQQITLEKGNQDHSVEISARILEPLKTPHGALRFASDDDIEKFHDLIGAHDPFHRRKNGMNKVETVLTDTKGRTMRLQENKMYILPITLTYKQYRELEALSQANGKAQTNLITGAQAGIPVSSTFRQAGAGAFSNVVHNRELNDRILLTLAAGVGVNVQRTLGNGYQPTDKPTSVHWSGNLAAGLTCLDAGNGKTSMYLTYDVKSALLDADKYKSNQGPYLQRLSAAAATEKDQSVGLALARQTENLTTYQFECREDFGGRNRKPKTVGGNNNRDFYCRLSVAQPF